ncbi:MAG: hypothetical protein AB7L13_03590 [Acidimicrobiia bacterium]
MQKLAFWIHQLVEYLVGFLVLSAGVRVSAGIGVPLTAGGVLLALAATADGPLGAFRWVSRPVHRILDMSAFVLLVVLVVVGFAIDATSAAAVTAVGAVMLAVLIVRTNYAPKPVRRPVTIPTTSEDVGRAAGKVVAKGVLGARALRDARRRAKDASGP